MSGSAYPSALLLDTCAMIWLANGDRLAEEVIEAIVIAARTNDLYVSVASAWEIGLLSNPRSPGRVGLVFKPDPKTWFKRFVAGPGIKEAAITSEIAIDASSLPGDIHGDPGDRLIVATARHLYATVVTRDRKLLNYAESGFVSVLAC